MSPVHQVWPKPSCKAQWKEEEDKADRGRGGKTASGNGQTWSSPSRRGQLRTGENERNWLRNLLWCPNDPRSQWINEMRSLYRTFKFYFVSEQYWSCIRIRKFRDALVWFQLGVSEIWTHKQRFCGGESEQADMNCPFCVDKLESECHFLFICKKYDVFRPRKMLNVDVNLVFCVDCSLVKVVMLVISST